MFFLQTTAKPVVKEFIKDSKSTISRVDGYFDSFINWLYLHIPELFFGILFFYIGRFIIKYLMKWIGKWMKIRQYDATVIPFVAALIKISLNVLLIILVLTFVGVNTTSFLTILGAAGLAVGLALQGSLSNFAGGVLILVFKPFIVGNYIKITGFSGSVKEINILYTYLTMDDNKIAIIPNGKITNSEIINFSMEDIRRIDIRFVLDYKTDIFKAKNILTEIIKGTENILSESKNYIGISELIESGIKMEYLVWVKRTDYLLTKTILMDSIVKQFQESGIEFTSSQPSTPTKL